MNLLGEREPPAQTDPRSPILGPQPCRQSASESPTFAEPLGNPQKPFPAGVPVDLCPRPGAEARALHTVPRSGTATKADGGGFLLKLTRRGRAGSSLVSARFSLGASGWRWGAFHAHVRSLSASGKRMPRSLSCPSGDLGTLNHADHLGDLTPKKKKKKRLNKTGKVHA